MKYLRLVFMAALVAALCHGWYGDEYDFHQETDDEFIARICGLMGWQPGDLGVDINLCRAMEAEFSHWK